MPYDVNRDDLDAHEPSLTSPSRRFPLLTPADNAELSVYPKALRIWNPGAAGATIRFTPIGESNDAIGAAVTVKLNAGADEVACGVRRIWATGTDPTLEIHGYVR